MAVRDLLWTCPRCPETPLRATRGGDRCEACGTLFRRGRGDLILARTRDGAVESRSAGEWLSLVSGRREADSGTRPEPAVLREAVPARPVRYAGELIGWMERFGRRVRGTLTLQEEALIFRSAEGTEVRVAIDDITSIQPSSRSLLLGRRNSSALALEFPQSSVPRWEHRLQTAVKRRWSASGRGEVVEYQPRIRAR